MKALIVIIGGIIIYLLIGVIEVLNSINEKLNRK